jgi:hypothetical protein
VAEIGALVRFWPGTREHNAGAGDDALEAVFESLGRVCVQRLVAAPHPFGLPPQDRRAAQRWLSRRRWMRKWKRDAAFVLTLVAVALAATLSVMSFYAPGDPPSDAVRKSSIAMIATRN